MRRAVHSPIIGKRETGIIVSCHCGWRGLEDTTEEALGKWAQHRAEEAVRRAKKRSSFQREETTPILVLI